MKPSGFDYARPTTIPEAVALLASAGGDAKVLAGGQSLVPLMNFRLAAPSLVVDVNRIPDLAGIRQVDARLEIGATTRMRALEQDPLVRQAVPILAAAARWVGHVQIRNRGTVGGSVAHADPAAEIPAICVLLDAELVAISERGTRIIPAGSFFSGFLMTDLAEDELLTAVRLPIPELADRWGFREFAQRRGDFALAGAAVMLGGTSAAIDRPRIAVFGTADRPVRASTAEATLIGRNASPDVLDAAARLAARETLADDPRPDADYRRRLTETLVQRALEDAVAAPIGSGT